MVSPLQSHRTTYGALALFFTEARRFDDEDIAALRTFAIHAAIALDNRRLMQEKERMAVHDGLTDVFNRGYLEIALERSVKHVRRNGGEVSVLFVDVDGMKDVNDTYGHQAGDACSWSWRGCCGTAAGSRTSSPATAATSSSSSCRTPARPAPRGRAQGGGRDRGAQRGRSGAPRLSASAGTHTATADGVDTLLREADRRMYASKRSRGAGRAQVSA